MRRLFLTVLLWWLCAAVFSGDVRGQGKKSNQPCQLPVVEINKCDFTETKLDFVFEYIPNPKSSDNKTPNFETYKYGLFFIRNNKKEKMKFANNKALIVADQYEELKNAEISLTFNLKEINFDPKLLTYSDKNIDSDYRISLLEILRVILRGKEIGKESDIVKMILFENKQPFNIQIGVDELPNDTGCSDVLFMEGNRLPVRYLFMYIDIDGCQDVNPLLSAISDTITAVKNSGGKYFIYLSNPSREPYKARSDNSLINVEEDFDNIRIEIRRIEPGRAIIDNDINSLRSDLTEILKQAKDKKWSPSELRFMFVLPPGDIGKTHKQKWESEFYGNEEQKIKGLIKETGSKATPFFYNCAFERIRTNN